MRRGNADRRLAELEDELSLARWEHRRRRIFWIVGALLVAGFVLFWVF